MRSRLTPVNSFWKKLGDVLNSMERAKEWVELSQALQRIKDILIKSEYMYPFKSELSALLAKRLRKLSP